MEYFMGLLEIVLVALGVIIIIVSCLQIDKGQNNTAQINTFDFSYDALKEEEKQKLISKLKDVITDISEESIIQTDDSLSKLSNEKIMAVSEYSDQILEKISRNHEEVVFLYNMLNDKEKELKSAVKEIDQSKKKVQDILDAKITSNKDQVSRNQQSAQKPLTQATQIENNKSLQQSSNRLSQELKDSNKANNNTEILKLYSQGSSVIEISKLLGLGQGEVKLVIDLFKNKK